MSATDAVAPEDGAPGAEARDAHHKSSFKLRFAAQREPGRSYVSPVKPRSLPATVTGKFYARDSRQPAEREAEQRALRRIADMFALGPRETLPAPLTESHVYGWHAGACERGARADRRRSHHVRDSAWLKARLRVLAADGKQQRN